MIVASISLRGLLRARRTLALAALPLLAAVVGAILAIFGSTPGDDFAGYTGTLLLPVATALVALVLGASSITEEREDLTILYTAQTPLPRWRIAVESWLAAWVATMLLVAPALAVGLVLGVRAGAPAGSLLALAAATVLASAAYTAVAVALGLLTRRAVVLGMLYVLLWEGSVASFAASADRLSIAGYARALAARGLETGQIEVLGAPDLSAGVGALVLVAATAAALALAARRLARMELP